MPDDKTCIVKTSSSKVTLSEKDVFKDPLEFNLTNLFTDVPLQVLNSPPAKKLPSERSFNTETILSNPTPSKLKLESNDPFAFNLAILPTDVPLTVVKFPTITNLPSDSSTTSTTKPPVPSEKTGALKVSSKVKSVLYLRTFLALLPSSDAPSIPTHRYLPPLNAMNLLPSGELPGTYALYSFFATSKSSTKTLLSGMRSVTCS